jgi:hypothetical protein
MIAPAAGLARKMVDGSEEESPQGAGTGNQGSATEGIFRRTEPLKGFA